MIPSLLLRSFIREYRASLTIILVSTAILAALSVLSLSREQQAINDVQLLTENIPFSLGKINSSLVKLILSSKLHQPYNLTTWKDAK